MEKDDYRFSLSAEKYLEKHHVLTYLEDSIAQLLEHKEENPKVNITKFFNDYFSSVKEGNHVMFREYSFVKATAHNRSSFVRTFWKCFRNIGRKGDLLSVREYHSLICLLCPDYPFQPVQKTARIILMDDAMDCLISFSDFLYAFQVQFSYDEFLSKCAEIYKELIQNPGSGHDTVVVPTSEERATTLHQNNIEQTSATEGVDSMQYFRSLIPACEKSEYSSPPLSVLREILSSAERVTFYGFLMAMARSEPLNKHIGKLPSKADLLEISDQELTSPPIRPSSAAKPRPNSAQRTLSASNAVTPVASTPPSTAQQPSNPVSANALAPIKNNGGPLLHTAQRILERATGIRSARSISRPHTSRRQTRASSSDDDDDDDDDNDDDDDDDSSDN